MKVNEPRALYEPAGEPGLGGISERWRGFPEPHWSVAGGVGDVGGVEAPDVRTAYTSHTSAQIYWGNSGIIEEFSGETLLKFH